MRTQTSFYGPLEITDYGDGNADVFRCEATLDGVSHCHVAALQREGRQWQVFTPGLPIISLGWVRVNHASLPSRIWEALQAHGETYVLMACKSTMAQAIEAVLEGQR